MSQRIAIIDYGMGNLHSVAKAIEKVKNHDDTVWITNDAQLIQLADRVIFPGQGAARDCMQAIQKQVLPAVKMAIATKPFLGICMGLQVLLDYSEENDGVNLLGILAGQVRFIGIRRDANGNLLKIPHMGWNQIQHTQAHSLWSSIPNSARFYFVHSYYVAPHNTNLIAATTDYGITFTSALAIANLFAVQFHPEKSSEYGLQLLTNFLHWQPDSCITNLQKCQVLN